jgi:hypothetical protein
MQTTLQNHKNKDMYMHGSVPREKSNEKQAENLTVQLNQSFDHFRDPSNIKKQRQ